MERVNHGETVRTGLDDIQRQWNLETQIDDYQAAGVFGI
jgi:hypothetical protein